MVLPFHQARCLVPSVQLFPPSIILAISPQVNPTPPPPHLFPHFPLTPSAQLCPPAPQPRASADSSLFLSVQWFLGSGSLLREWKKYIEGPQGSFSGIARGSPCSAPTSLTPWETGTRHEVSNPGSMRMERVGRRAHLRVEEDGEKPGIPIYLLTGGTPTSSPTPPRGRRSPGLTQVQRGQGEGQASYSSPGSK